MSPKMPLRVIALSGKMRSGKTFAADHLYNEHGFARFRFAGPLKDDIRSMGFPEWAIEKKPDWMRLLMQAYGQARRAIDPDHWVKQLVADIRNTRALQLSGNAYDDLPGIVIDDMRFPNEANALLNLDPAEYDVKLIRIYRLGDPGDVSHTDDTSETALDHFGEFTAVVQAEAGDTDALVRGVETSIGIFRKE